MGDTGKGKVRSSAVAAGTHQCSGTTSTASYPVHLLAPLVGCPVPPCHGRRLSVPVLSCALQKKKSGVESINSRLALVMKSGKVTMGYKSTLKSLRMGKCAALPRRTAARALVAGKSAARRSKAGTALPAFFLSRSKARTDLEQLPAAPQVGDRVLRDACQDPRSPLHRK